MTSPTFELGAPIYRIYLYPVDPPNSNSIGDRKNARSKKSSNYRDSNYESFWLEDFQKT